MNRAVLTVALIIAALAALLAFLLWREDHVRYGTPRRVALFDPVAERYVRQLEGFCFATPTNGKPLSVTVICRADDGRMEEHVWLVGGAGIVLAEPL